MQKIDNVELKNPQSKVDVVRIGNEDFFKITNVEELRPFFMSIVSHSNHWMFVSSNGGLSAGRKNSEFALFHIIPTTKSQNLLK